MLNPVYPFEKTRPNLQPMRDTLHKYFYDSSTAGGAGFLGMMHHAAPYLVFFASLMAPIVRDVTINLVTRFGPVIWNKLFNKKNIK